MTHLGLHTVGKFHRRSRLTQARPGGPRWVGARPVSGPSPRARAGSRGDPRRRGCRGRVGDGSHVGRAPPTPACGAVLGDTLPSEGPCSSRGCPQRRAAVRTGDCGASPLPAGEARSPDPCPVSPPPSPSGHAATFRVRAPRAGRFAALDLRMCGSTFSLPPECGRPLHLGDFCSVSLTSSSKNKFTLRM